MTEDYKEINEKIITLKKQNQLTNKMTVFIHGYILGMLMSDKITLEEAVKLRDMLDIDKADSMGVSELFTFGDIQDFKKSKLEF